MPEEIIAKHATLTRRIAERKRTAAKVEEIILQSRLHAHGGSDPTQGAEPEHRSPVARENLRELMHRGHATAQSNEFDNVVPERMRQDPELHGMKRLLAEKEEKIARIRKESLWKRAQRKLARKDPPAHATHAERIAHEREHGRGDAHDHHHHDEPVPHSVLH